MTTSNPDRVALRLPGIAVEEVEHALAPGVDRVVGLEQADRRDAARPLEGAEEDVVGGAGDVAGDELVLPQARPQRLERAAEVGELLLRLGGKLLERHAEALLARL